MPQEQRNHDPITTATGRPNSMSLSYTSTATVSGDRAVAAPGIESVSVVDEATNRRYA